MTSRILTSLASVAWAPVWLGIAVTLSQITLPSLFAHVADDLGVGDRELAWLATADLLGMAAGGVAASWVVAGPHLRRCTWAATLAFVLLNLACVPIEDWRVLIAVRGGVGLAAGVVLGACYTALGRTSDADRQFAYMTAVAILVSALGLGGIPSFVRVAGVDAMWFAIATVGAVCAPLVERTCRMAEGACEPTPEGPRSSRRLVPAVLTVLALYAAGGCLYLFYDRIAVQAGLSGENVGAALAFAQLLALAGAMVAIALANLRFRRIALLAGLIVVAGSGALLGAAMTPAVFVVSASLFSASWNFVLPFQLGAIADSDPSGVSVAASAGVSYLGLASGPALASLVVGGDSYAPVGLLSVGLAALATASAVPLLARPRLATHIST